MNFLKNLFSRSDTKTREIPNPDFSDLIIKIKKQEEFNDIRLGEKIHEFDYNYFTLRLDRDITKNYRITVSQGNERIYSFTVFANKGEYMKLENAYREVIMFLKGDRKIAALPKTNTLKGYFFGFD